MIVSQFMLTMNSLRVFQRCRQLFITANSRANTAVRPKLVPGIHSCLAAAFYSTGSGSKENIDKLVKNHKVVVFMKGVPDQPRCGFSNAVVQILNMHGVEFEAHDVLANEDLRQGIKEYSNWPTIPQVFINGEFIGGCDILLQMHQSGEIIDELKKANIKSALLDSTNEKEDKK